MNKMNIENFVKTTMDTENKMINQIEEKSQVNVKKTKEIQNIQSLIEMPKRNEQILSINLNKDFETTNPSGHSKDLGNIQLHCTTPKNINETGETEAHSSSTVNLLKRCHNNQENIVDQDVKTDGCVIVENTDEMYKEQKRQISMDGVTWWLHRNNEELEIYKGDYEDEESSNNEILENPSVYDYDSLFSHADRPISAPCRLQLIRKHLSPSVNEEILTTPSQVTVISSIKEETTSDESLQALNESMTAIETFPTQEDFLIIMKPKNQSQNSTHKNISEENISNEDILNTQSAEIDETLETPSKAIKRKHKNSKH